MISAFGLAVELALPVPELDPVPSVPAELVPPGPVLRVQLAEAEELDATWSGPMEPPRQAHAVVDGSDWTAERGRDSDLAMRHALCRFHLDGNATLLRCAPADPAAPAWRRLLLDTALVTASLVRGHDALHAGCVVKGDVAIAIAGETGVGKTTLLLNLIRAGARFLADDVIALTVREDGVVAHPGPPLANFPVSEQLDDFAEPLHSLGGEQWVRVRRPYLSPAPLRVVLVLSRAHPGCDTPPVAPVHETAAPLLRHALQGGTTRQRREQRFALLARLAASAQVLAVNVDLSRPRGELVEQLRSAVPALQA